MSRDQSDPAGEGRGFFPFFRLPLPFAALSQELKSLLLLSAAHLTLSWSPWACLALGVMLVL